MTRNERTEYFGVSPSDMVAHGLSKRPSQYSGLIEAIILRAVKDYSEIKNAKHSISSSIDKDGIQINTSEIEDFFSSQWFKILTGVNGAIYVPSLRNGDFKISELYKRYNTIS